MQTSCSIKNKMSIPFFWVVKIFRIEVAQPIFFAHNLFNNFFQEFICFYRHFKAFIFIKKSATWIFIWWYNVDIILNYDRCKQILIISAILRPCESWKKAENQLRNCILKFCHYVLERDFFPFPLCNRGLCLLE